MPKIKKVILTKDDVYKLQKNKVLRIGNFLLKIDEVFSVPGVRVYGD